ncbi:MAG: protein kinase domain-containing protein [Acidobacteriota bacterium]
MAEQQISRYRIIRRIGAGGMGEVYLAHDPTLDRQVAVKVLPSGLARDQSARRRLLSEAQAAARLDHPFICKVYEVGEADGHPFIAMEFIQGATLHERIRKRPLPIKEVLRLGVEIAEALDFAHRRDIVHRDLKPSNIMVGDDGHVKVMDFGVAKQLGVAGATETATGQAVGTTAYMSPEQLRGEPVDGRSDIFAFGLILHEMATGANPFLRSSPYSTADAILHEVAPPLEERVHDAPPLLAHVMTRCLEKDRERRYQSLRDVQIELSTLVEGPATPSRRPVVVPPRRRLRWRTVGAVAATLVVTAVGVTWLWSDRLGMSRSAIAFSERDWVIVSDFENLTSDSVFDRSVRVALEVGLAQSPYLNVLPPSAVQAALGRMQRATGERLEEALACEIAVREGARAVLAGSIAQLGDGYVLTAKLLDPATRMAALTRSVRAPDRMAILDSLDELVRTMRQELGESLASISRTSVPLPRATTPSLDALKLFAESLKFGVIGNDAAAGEELLRQALVIDPQFAMAHAELGRRHYLNGASQIRQLGEEHVTKALSLLERLTPRERLWIQASAEDSRGNRQRAVEAYQAYLSSYQDDARAWFRLGWTLMAGLGQYDAAADAFRRVIALTPFDSAAHINLATSFKGLGKNSEALEIYRKAFELSPNALLEPNINHEYGFTLVQVGKVEEAAGVFAKLIASPEPFRRARGHRSMAWLEMFRGRYTAAIEQLRQAILINQTTGAGISEFRDRLILVRALQASGGSSAARTEFSAVDALIARMSLGPEWLRDPVKILARQGRVAEARRLLALMNKTAGSSTSDSAMNRNVAMDQSYIDHARGEIAVADGRADEALPLLHAALVPRNDPSIVESLAAAHLAAGQYAGAAQRFEEFIASRPLGLEAQQDWFAAHVRLGDAYSRLGRAEDARRLYQQLVDRWKDADATLPLLDEARTRLSRP